MTANGRESGEGETSASRLMNAVIGQWERCGSSAISVRSLATEAGVTVSSLYHHFGSLEHLYLSAQLHARSGAQRWCADQLRTLARFEPLAPDALPALVAALIDDWTNGPRGLAFAWRECVMAAAREPGFLRELQAWSAMWSAFWQDVCARCGRVEHGALVTMFFYSESLLHLMRWHPIVDRSALADLCVGLTTWLDGSLAEEGPWRRIARAEAIRTMPPPPVLGELSGRIATAAAALLQREGLAALTHRAVAAEAGLTLGVVSHHMRTSADLVRAAFEIVYRDAAGLDDAAPAPLAIDDEELVARLIRFQQDRTSLLALDELMLAAGRDPALGSFVPQLRYLRGRTSRTLMPVIAGQEGSPVDHALLSGLISGLRVACLGSAADAVPGLVRETLEHIFALLRRPGAG